MGIAGRGKWGENHQPRHAPSPRQGRVWGHLPALPSMEANARCGGRESSLAATLGCRGQRREEGLPARNSSHCWASKPLLSTGTFSLPRPPLDHEVKRARQIPVMLASFGMLRSACGTESVGGSLTQRWRQPIVRAQDAAAPAKVGRGTRRKRPDNGHRRGSDALPTYRIQASPSFRG